MTSRRSLRWELIAVLAALLMLAVFSLSALTEWLSRETAMRREADAVDAHAHALTALLRPHLRTTRVVDEGGDVEAILRASLGRLGIERLELWRFSEAGTDRALTVGVTDALEQDPEAHGLPTARVEDDRIRAERPLPAVGTGPRFVLRIIARPSAWAPWTETPGPWLLPLGVGIVVFVLGVLLVEHNVVRPLARIKRAVESFAAGNLDERAPASGPAELEALARGFNDMASALRHRIDELANQRAALVRAEQLASVGRIAAGTAHEIGNPLAAVLGYVELLLDARGPNPSSNEQRELLRRVQSQLSRMQNTVAQLLEYARPSTRSLQPVALLEHVQLLLRLLQHDPRCRGIDMELEGDRAVYGYADGTALDQILQNLVVNAARACSSRKDAKLRITVSQDEAGAWISVEDNGPGIPDELRPRLFEPFVTTAPAGEGTGLGLAISEGLAREMGGELREMPPQVEAGLPGARFELRLARAAPAATPHA